MVLPMQPRSGRGASTADQPIADAGHRADAETIGDTRVEVRRSARRKRTVQAYRQGDAIVVLLPQGMSAQEEKRYVDSLVGRVLAQEARRVEQPDVLLDRARRLSERYLSPELGAAPLPTSVTWVGNQQKRWGSCSVGSGDIRLSDRLQQMPIWVQDYVLLHELVHLVVPDHGRRFRALLDAYPRGERARGYLEGFQAGSGRAGLGDDAD